MKNQGIIFYGSNEDLVRKAAFDMALDYLRNENINKDMLSKYIFSNTYPNFFHLKKASDENEISIEKSREIINFLSQKPSLSGNRAVLVENFEEMSRNASNSILKILEEPPLNSIIILTTTQLFSILPTIRSRCIKFRVKSEDILSAKDYATSFEFAKAKLNDIDLKLIGKFDKFINSGCVNCIEFAKENSANFIEFLKVALVFCSFKSSFGNLEYSNKLLSLQEFYNLAESTYPDKQATIIAVCKILSC